MKHSKFEFRQLSTNRIGFSGMIEIHVTESVCHQDTREMIDIQFPDYMNLYSSAYSISLRFGATLFIEKYKKLFIGKTINVKIIDIGIYAVDTSPMVMLYVLYKALLQAYNLADDLITFNSEYGFFEVQKN